MVCPLLHWITISITTIITNHFHGSRITSSKWWSWRNPLRRVVLLATLSSGLWKRVGELKTVRRHVSNRYSSFVPYHTLYMPCYMLCYMLCYMPCYTLCYMPIICSVYVSCSCFIIQSYNQNTKQKQKSRERLGWLGCQLYLGSRKCQLVRSRIIPSRIQYQFNISLCITYTLYGHIMFLKLINVWKISRVDI